MNKVKVGIQGVRASFHDTAAALFFNDYDVYECASFKILCEALKSKACDFCMMAIENTIAGSILTNYALLEAYRFKIIGEVYLRIEMNLLALPGESVTSLQFVQSHPMALFQCEEFFFQHPHLKILESNDTAESAKNIAAQKLKHYGTVASRLAAERYGLEILKSGIETNKQNYTRFLVIAREEKLTSQNIKFLSHEAKKASLRFETPNQPGGLVSILEIFKAQNINMTKIQSVPILGKPYQYSIHVDIEWDDLRAFEKTRGLLEKKALGVLYFGEYPKGEFNFP